MYVPTLGVEPSVIAPRPEGLEEVAAPAARRPRVTQVQPVSLEDVDIGPPPEVSPPPRKAARPARKAKRAEDDEVLAEAADAGDEPAKARKPFSKLAVFLILLAILALGALAAAPFLPGPTSQATGWFVKNMSEKPVGVPEDKALFVAAAPGPIILILLLALLMGLATREWTFLPIALTYIASFLVAGLAFFAAYQAQADLATMDAIDKRVAAEKVKMAQDTPPRDGDYKVEMGLQLPVAAGAVAAAALFLLLAALLMHRRWWARALAFLILLAPTALVVVWNFRKELGVEALSPI